MRIQPQTVMCTMAIIVLTPFVWILLFTGNDLTEVDLMEKRLAELRDRLHYAESLNQEREHDLLNLRSQVKLLMGFQKHANENRNTSDSMFDDQKVNQILANISLLTGNSGDVHTGDDLSLPNVYHYLPHLIGQSDGIRPSLKFSQGRSGVSIVIGVPTIKREKESYLTRTLQSLIDSLSDDEKFDCLIVVYIGEKNDQTFVRNTADEVKLKFPEALKSGLLEVVAPSPKFYPSMSDLKDTFGDTMERVRWRTKQNLDYTFLMMYARSRGTYYVQLEDDVMTKPGYMTTMKNFALNQKMNDWILLEFSHLGFIGKLFKSRDLPFIVEFFLMFHKDKPVDWLLDHLLYVKVCNPEKDNKHCQRSMEDLRHRYKPSLFQHIGTYSSLKGKVQKLKDKDFGKGVMHQAHVNPNAEVSTTLKVYDQYSLDRAYMGEVFFWGVLPQQHDTVVFKFSPPIVVDKYLFRSGNPEHPGDKFYNTTIEVLVSSWQTGKLDNNALLTTKFPLTEDGFRIINRFDHDSGLAEGSMPDFIGPIEVLRLYVQSSSQSWVILSEILIHEAQQKTTTN